MHSLLCFDIAFLAALNPMLHCNQGCSCARLLPTPASHAAEQHPYSSCTAAVASCSRLVGSVKDAFTILLAPIFWALLPCMLLFIWAKWVGML